jgi:hypothetical protein
MAENNEKLENFSWDTWDEASLGEAKQEAEKQPEKEEVAQPVKEEVEAKEEIKKEVEEEVEEKEIDFDNIDFVEEDESNDKETSTNSNLISQLKDNGIFAALEDEEFADGLSDEDLPDMIDKEVDARVEETMESFFDEMDDDGIAFLKFKKNGGKTSDFLNAYNKFNSTPSGDLDDESYQESVVKHGMKLEGYDEEDINDKIEWLKEGAKLKRHAQKYEAKIDNAKAIEKEKIVKQQKIQAQEQAKQRENLSQELKDKLEEVDTIGQFTFSKKDKKHLHSYMTRANVKVGKDTYMTQMQTDLQNVFQDPEKILIIAKLLRNDFDVSDVIRDTETKVTRKTKDKIERKSTKMKSSNSSTGRRKKALFEYFDD